jgi:cobalamin-dependent methionine synthase I
MILGLEGFLQSVGVIGHEIGRILSVLFGCNNYEVMDLGVMVSSDSIITNRNHHVDVVDLATHHTISG